MEVWRPRRQSAQNRSLHLPNICAAPADKCFAQIGYGKRIPSAERAGAGTSHGEDRQPGDVEYRGVASAIPMRTRAISPETLKEWSRRRVGWRAKIVGLDYAARVQGLVELPELRAEKPRLKRSPAPCHEPSGRWTLTAKLGILGGSDCACALPSTATKHKIML